MFRQELKKQLIKNRLALLLIAVIAVDALYALSASVKPVDIGDRVFSDSLLDMIFFAKYRSAWHMILDSSSLNWALLIFTCVATLKIWVNEYKFNMQIYNLTSANGRAGLAVKKVMLNMGFVLSGAVIADLLRILIYGITLSFDDWPLAECGSFYLTTEFELTGAQTCFISILLHIVGYLLFCSLCILAAVVIRNSVNCLGVCFSIILIPLYIFDDTETRLRLPFPISFLQGEQMFYGSRIDDATADSENPVYTFKALSQSEIILNVILALLITAAAIYLSILIFSGNGLKFPKIKKRKALVLPLVALMLFSGCSSTLPKENGSDYILVEASSENVYSKERDEIFSINPTPFTERNVHQIYGNYAIVTEHINPDYHTQSIYVKAVNLDDLSEKLIYVFGKESDIDGMMGLNDIINIPAWLLADPEITDPSTNFTFADNKLYFGRSDHILCIDTSSGKKTKLLEGIKRGDMTVTDEGIYYTHEGEGILYFNSDDTIVCDFPIRSYVVGDGAIAVSGREDKCPYLITPEGTRKISDTKVNSFCYASDNKVVFTTDSGTTVAVIGDSEISYDDRAFYADDDGVYFVDYESLSVERRSY